MYNKDIKGTNLLVALATLRSPLKITNEVMIETKIATTTALILNDPEIALVIVLD